MKATLRFLLTYLAYWLAWMIALRALFLGYHHAEAARLGAVGLAAVLVHGLRLDISAAAYATLVPILLLVLSAVMPMRAIRIATHIVSMAVLVVVAVLVTADLELYAAWGSRLDATVLPYLRTPREAVASAGAAPVGRLVLILLVVLALGAWTYWRFVAPRLRAVPPGKPAPALAVVGCGALLIVPIRGGLQQIPLNPSAAYFSRDDFANQAALDEPWTFVHSVVNQDYRNTNPYTAGPSADEARAIVDSLVRTVGPDAHLLRFQRPNVVLIVWESLTAKVVGSLGGVPGVTPAFDSLAHQGVLFDSIYASGDRSAKGLVALLSGFPALPHAQIITTPSKARTLPALPRDLARSGWHTALYYGGELEFADFKAYFLSHDYERLVGKSDFARSELNSKWGAHDHIVLGRVLRELATMPRPFFTTVFTLSSHEPFEIPMRPRFRGGDQTARFLSAHAYTDSAVGGFIAAARRAPWWDSTLIIIVADHGHVLPPTPPGDARPWRETHIPMLWLGGALAVRDTVVHVIGSQVDLPATLLAQLGLPHASYRWGKDLLARTVVPFAYFPWLDGFGWTRPGARVVWNNVTHQETARIGDPTAADVRAGQAYQRLAYQDYLDR